MQDACCSTGVLDHSCPVPLYLLQHTLPSATFLQLDQSLLATLKTEIQAKAEIKGNLDTYKYYDNVSTAIAPGSCCCATRPIAVMQRNC